jgi:glycerol-3-phosphate O-acyltransferase
MNVFQILRQHPSELNIPMDVFEYTFESALSDLKDLEADGKVKIEAVNDRSTKELIIDGMKNLGIYHGQKVLYISKNKVRSKSIKLLYYYHNRTEGYDLEYKMDWSKVKEVSYLEKLQEEI